MRGTTKTKNVAKAPKNPRKMSRVKMPSFKSEAEEAAWWDRNPGFVADQFEKAAKEGRIFRDLPGHNVTRSVTIRLAVKDVEMAQALAAKTGLPYQTYIKTVLHQALESARKIG
jgi:predicted DNA binding CopG/RHH family protein